jgi:hypothetical protein
MPRKSYRVGPLLIAALVIAILAAACSSPASVSGDLQLKDVWARAAKAGEMAQGEMQMEDSHAGMGANSAAYMVIANSGKEPDRLISAKADVSKAVEIHETVMEGDVMRMQPVQGGIEVPAGGQVELKPGGYHVMFIGLTRDLNGGDKFPLTLQFEKGGEVTVEAEVRQP